MSTQAGARLPPRSRRFTFEEMKLQLANTLGFLLFLSTLGLSPQYRQQCRTSHDAGIGRCEVNRRDALASSGTAAILASGGILFPSASYASSTDPIQPVKILPGGASFPLATFGLQIYDDDTAYKLTITALEVGYRNFFASVLAGNQRGFAKAVKDSRVPREELFICGSVVSNRAKGFDEAYQLTTRGWKKNMEAFSVGDIDYLDQIMLDYPGPDCLSIRGQWKAFEDMYDQKLTRTLAVSNFSPAQLDCILDDPTTKVRPVVNQLPFSVAYHPGGASSIVQENQKRDVLVQAWAPLGGSLGGRFDSKIKSKCAQIGEQYGKSYAQVALRWILQKGGSFTTQSRRRQHFAENLEIFDFELTDEDMASLDSLG